MKWLAEAWDELTVYLLTFLGVMMAFYAPIFKLGYDGPTEIKVPQLLFGAGLSLMITLTQEAAKPGLDPHVARRGKRRNWALRFAAAFTSGYTWPSLFSTFGGS